ncbi:aminotransferase class V-fold PLP-dependent enzyme [Luedemannella helvata]|uniref:Aminotransferase class V domain-containing protein n=1 Tax=Luedemannella helvata TaxID=349315 RepID=A0ABP4WXR4_9ACTN
MATARQLADQIEADPLGKLGSTALAPRFRAICEQLCADLRLHPDHTVLTPNTTSASAALIASLPLAERDVVVVLDTEYASVMRGWQVRCHQAGARFVTVPVSLPFTGPEQLLANLDGAVAGGVTYLVASHISSSTAILFPLDEVGQWVAARGGRLLVDTAHTPGHVPAPVPGGPIAAVFGNVHKWYPAMRSVGLLSLAPDLVDIVRPAEVSLTWDCDDLTERFSWPGTFDPTPRLSVPAAIAQYTEWCEAGRLAACQRLADRTVTIMVALGATPTTSPEFMPPRMRAFFLDGVSVVDVKTALSAANIRAWVGSDAGGRTILRVATHVYNDAADLSLLGSTIKERLAR